ncbi:hypothetical protein [Nocardia asteroides]|uniref:hypothetical protein n=1 Tax=Nocardia asteroides TaxID=1824 RepID=UPI003657CAE8
MPLSRPTASCLGPLTALALAAGALLTPTTAHAEVAPTLAAIPIGDAAPLCTPGAPTFDDVVTAAASVLRGVVGPDRLADYDRQVAEVRTALATARVHRMVPTVGIFLKPVVGAAFTGTKALARAVQALLVAGCVAPNAYPPLELDATATEPVDVPRPVEDLAALVMTADGSCTPIADLTLAAVVERSRAYLNSGAVPVDSVAMNQAADDLQVFLAGNRVAEVMLIRRSDELGPLFEALDLGPLTFLADLGADLADGTALDTVPLAQVRVENAFDLATLTIDIISLLFSAGTSIAGYAGVADAVLTPLSIVQKLAFAPTDYGAPIVRGVIQSMCAV